MEASRKYPCPRTMTNHPQILETLARCAKRAAELIVLTCLLRPMALPQDASHTEATIRALEAQWAYAQAHNDNRALNLIFDNALVYVEYNRLVSKGEYLARIRQELPSSDEIVMEPASVRISKHTAIVIGSYREKKRQRGRREKTRWRFVDTWVYKANGWVLVAAAATPIK